MGRDVSRLAGAHLLHNALKNGGTSCPVVSPSLKPQPVIPVF